MQNMFGHFSIVLQLDLELLGVFVQGLVFFKPMLDVLTGPGNHRLGCQIWH